LYMQSRFPRKDRENGKTSARYAVFQGFSDLFPDFEDWLAARISADVHGHLFSRDNVEFAGRPAVGPGGFPDSPAFRDHDPKGFLSSLIRISPRMQVFQHGPRDSQDLNWFMATDPNARLFIITGAWAAALIASTMPFDDIRRAAARFQRAEQAQLQILRSVWVKARVGIWDLAAFAADPAPVLDSILRQIDPAAAAALPLPQMRSLDGLPELLRRLRNAGLRSYLTGNITAADGTGPRDA
ncbi:MAG: glycosyl transferase, partial [Paracoccus sp. (in: a-proteobacteria)]|nr:glycosyl transferase [Paracoccus sp. (in: a-proteobacteria)]